MQTIRKSVETAASNDPGRPRQAWPVPSHSLAALTDMGMSDDAIGRYFGVDPTTVRHARLGDESLAIPA